MTEGKQKLWAPKNWSCHNDTIMGGVVQIARSSQNHPENEYWQELTDPHFLTDHVLRRKFKRDT